MATEKKIITTWNKKASPTKKASTVTKKQASTTTQQKINAAEKTVDAVADKVSKQVSASVSPKVRSKANKLAHEAETIASKVESFGQELEQVTDSIFSDMKGSDGQFSAERSEKVSRLFIFRCLRLILQGPILFVWSIWYCIISIIHYVTMFVAGKRNKVLREKQTRYRRHVIAWKSYMNALTDKRPELLVD